MARIEEVRVDPWHPWFIFFLGCGFAALSYSAVPQNNLGEDFRGWHFLLTSALQADSMFPQFRNPRCARAFAAGLENAKHQENLWALGKSVEPTPKDFGALAPHCVSHCVEPTRLVDLP
ncbi:MAG: hypothetical protein ACLQM8_02900 [Limisphaerales bacterium]